MNAATSPANSKIIRFEDHVPITVVMDGKRGIAGEPQSNQWGNEEWKHWVNGDENIMYLPAGAQKQLELSGAQYKDWVTFEKIRGGKNQIWRVTVDEPYSDRAQLGRRNYLDQGTASAPAATPIRETLNGKAIRQQADLAQHIAAGESRIDMNATIAAAAAASSIERPEAKAMVHALHCAIDAIGIAQQYAASRNLTIQFSGEDVRAFAITAYINASKGARP